MTAEGSQALRTRYDGQEARRIVLKAALRVFSELGFEGASTRAIASAAGIEQGHLAYYYRSKMELWKQVVEAFAQEGQESLRRHLPPEGMSEPAKIARKALPALLRSFARNPELTRIMLQEFSVRSPRHEWVVENFGRPIWLQLRPLFEALHKEGMLSGATPALAYFSLIGSALIIFGNPQIISAFAGEEVQEADWIDQAIEHMMRPVLARPL